MMERNAFKRACVSHHCLSRAAWQNSRETSGPGLALQRGLTLVELMVTTLISSLILAGVLTLVVNNSRAVRVQEEIAFIQENARFAMELLSRDVRMAGYFGCGTGGNLAVSVEGDTSGFLGFAGIQGFDHSQADNLWPDEIASVKNAGSDAFIVRSADIESSFHVSSHNGNSAVIHLNGSHPYQPGTIMVLSDSSCRQAGVFAISGPTNSSGNATQIVHHTGNAGSVQNCSRMLWGSFSCNDCNQSGTNCGPGASSKSYGKGSQVMALNASAYYIAPSAVDPNMPALHRKRLGDAGAIESEELVVGVESMRILYGVDTASPTPNREVDRYLPASEITSMKDSETTDNIAWNRVSAVKVTLVLRSFAPVLSGDEAVKLAEGLEYQDRYLRQLSTTTIRLRNSGGVVGS